MIGLAGMTVHTGIQTGCFGLSPHTFPHRQVALMLEHVHVVASHFLGGCYALGARIFYLDDGFRRSSRPSRGSDDRDHRGQNVPKG